MSEVVSEVGLDGIESSIVCFEIFDNTRERDGRTY